MWIRFINEMLLNIKNEIFLISEYHTHFSFIDSGYYWVFPRQKCVYYTKAIKCLYNHLWYNHIHSIFNVTCMTKAFCFKHTMYVKHVYWTKEEKLYFAQMLFIIWEDYHYNFHNHIFYIENIFLSGR